jgi:hypothetical protein
MNHQSLVAIDLDTLAHVIGGAAASRPSGSRLDPQIKTMLTQVQDAVKTMASESKNSSSSTMLPMMMMMMMRK